MIARLVTIGAIFFALLGWSGRSLGSAGPARRCPAAARTHVDHAAFADGAEVPPRFTQSSQTPMSPKLEWTNVPPNTVTFALIMHDSRRRP